MGTHIIDAFFVSFGIKAEGFKSGSKEITEATKRLKEESRKNFGEIERHGKDAGQAFKSLRNEVSGLLLTFMGASSIASFATNMLTSTANAGRLGEVIGTTTDKIYAWRAAMQGVGSDSQSADAALRTMNGIKMDFLHGTLGPRSALMASFKISNDDLRNLDPSDLLLKLGTAKRPYGNQEFADRLGQLGFGDGVKNFLMDGDKAKSQIEELRKNTDAMKKQEAAAQKLQESLAKLQLTVTEKLAPDITRLADGLDKFIRWLDKYNVIDKVGQVNDTAKGMAFGPFTLGPKIGNWLGDKINGWFGGGGSAPAAGARPAGSGAGGAGGGSFSGSAKAAPYANALRAAGFSNTMIAAILGNMEHESRFDPKTVGDGGKARGVLQWHPDRQADFRRMFHTDVSNATPAQVAEFIKWELQHNVTAQGLAKILRAANSGDAGRTAKMFDQYYERSKGLSRLQRANAANAYARSVTIGSITVNTKATDAHGIARDLNNAIRRSVVVRADRGVAP